MKRWIILCFCLFLTVSGCGRIMRDVPNQGQPLPATGSAAAIDEGPTISSDLPSVESTPLPLPDFDSMSFVEKNNLYLQLINEEQQAGLDTSHADEVYFRSLEASLAGNAAADDEYLHEAILLLWDN